MLKLLTSLPPQDLRAFKKALLEKNSLLHPTQRNITLFKYWYTNRHQKNAYKLTKKLAYKKLFPKQPFILKDITDEMSELTKILENYIIFKRVNKVDIVRRKLLLEEYQEREMHEWAKREITALEKKIEALPTKNADYHYEKFLLEQRKYFHPDTEHFGATLKLLKSTILHLNTYYVITRLQYACELKARQYTLVEQAEFLFAKAIPNILQYISVVDTRAIKIYSDLLKLLEQEHSDNLFENTKTTFLNSLNFISKGEQRFILQNLINHTNYVFKNGHQDYLNKQFELYQLGLEHDMFLYHGRLSDITYTNIAVIGSKLEEFDWTITFLEKYKSNLAPETIKNATNFGRAYWYYNKGNLKIALELLDKKNIQYSKIPYGLRAKSLILRVYYETFRSNGDYFDELSAHFEAFKKYLISKKKKINPFLMEGYLNLIKYTKYLFNYNIHNKSPKTLNAWIDEINKEPAFVMKQWIITKIEELKN